MAFGCYLQVPREPCVIKNCVHANSSKRLELKGRGHLLTLSLSSRFSQQDHWILHVSSSIRKRTYYFYRYNTFKCQSFAVPSGIARNPTLKATALALRRSYTALHATPLVYQLVPAVGVIVFALWGLGPLLRLGRRLFFDSNDNTWRKSRTQYIFTSFLQPLLLWSGATLICRALDPVILPSEASQAIKQRLLTFIRSLSTVMAFAFCLSSFIQKTQNFFMETSDSNDARNMGFQFAGKAIYTAVWVAAFSLFMELLGFPPRNGSRLEIFTNFLSSVMIHATRPFVLNEWIQTKIEGYEVSGTVEHVGWWSPTIIRGDDREAVHIPNHKFTVSVYSIQNIDADRFYVKNIVADMRKVLAKNPQVEQQKLHRRVFLDNVDPENQALLILISCFVKTPHFEEYLGVKEAILLDLLRVIRHHRARLATPIRTVQKFYGDSDIEKIPFADTIFSRPGAASSRSLLLIEPPLKTPGEEKPKSRQTPRTGEDLKETISTSEAPLPESSDNAQPPKPSPEERSEEKKLQKPVPGDVHVKSSSMEASSSPSAKLQPEDSGVGSLGSKESPPGSASAQENVADTATSPAPPSERSHGPPPPSMPGRPSLEENIVLGVALDGAKRTLPIEEGLVPAPNPVDSKEMASLRSGSGPASSTKEKKDGQAPAPGGPAAEQPRDQ
ncbi:unnamed protein product [Spirodela intermedia]|uniref:Uncharacterized protein n=1 Tax=Spirodela intermedia TaxID=51605 RepID=A0A7I8I7M0_SPIIN|nr:unnamed protein product [Spirodela intermedia]CAA6653438.1 unnamed protein product [Spirodela intermedia]